MARPRMRRWISHVLGAALLVSGTGGVLMGAGVVGVETTGAPAPTTTALPTAALGPLDRADAAVRSPLSDHPWQQATSSGGVAALAESEYVAVTSVQTPASASTSAATSGPASSGSTATSALPPGATYYVDSVNGADRNSGLSETNAWRTLKKASAVLLAPGDQLLFQRGRSWTGGFDAAWTGAAGRPITIGAYGRGSAPTFTGSSSCITVSGAYLVLTDVVGLDCTWAGISISGDHNLVRRAHVTGNAAGVHIQPGALVNVVESSEIVSNTRMSVLAPGGDDDSGAFGVLIEGDRNEIVGNTISGHDAFSDDYGRDGSAVEIYGGVGNHIHHNVATGNRAFSELGQSRSADTTYAYNLVTSSLANSSFVITRGADSRWGPVRSTRLFNNTALMTGPGSQGFVCHDGCGTGILMMRNNIVQAVSKAGYADAPFDGDYNLYWGGSRDFTLGANDQIAEPQFVDPPTDVRPQLTSPAIDTGVALAGITPFSYAHDVAGQPLADREPDRGAFERAG